jgi:CDGSH-type Zn-finger protein
VAEVQASNDAERLRDVLRQVDQTLESVAHEMMGTEVCNCGDRAYHPHDGNHSGTAMGSAAKAAEMAMALAPVVKSVLGQ